MHTKIPCHSDEAVDVTAPTTTKSVAKPSKLFPYRTISVWTADVAKVLLEYEAGFRGRSDDIVVASFPKSGTTWTQAMVQLIMFGYVSRVNGLGLDVSDRWISTGRLPLDVVEGRPSPRLIKTHLPLNLYPKHFNKKCKIIYVYRNIKDVCVSMYHFCNGVKAMRDAHEVGSFEEFAESFMRGDVFYGPYFQNLKSYWKRRDDANILLLRYEDLSKNPHQNVSKLATFLDRKLDVDQVNDIVRRTSFEEMKKLDDSYDTKTRGNEEFDESYRFIRSGQPEQWKSHFTPSLLNKMNSWIAENLSTEELANFDGS